jgi:hypothetical protein
VPNVLENHRPHGAQRTPAAAVHRSKAHATPLLVERVVMAPIAGVSREHDDAAPHARSGGRESEHVVRAETSHDQAERSGSGGGGDRSGSDGSRDGHGQKGDGSDGSSSGPGPSSDGSGD